MQLSKWYMLGFIIKAFIHSALSALQPLAIIVYHLMFYFWPGLHEKELKHHYTFT
jgi:hypothetical protein